MSECEKNNKIMKAKIKVDTKVINNINNINNNFIINTYS